jgi:Rrf2 family protein
MMVAVARQTDGRRPVSLRNVSKTTMISRRYLEQVASGLKHADLLSSTSGRAGGYVLKRPAEEISLLEIVEASIGPINVVECVREPDECLKADLCECRWVYRLINDGIRDLLEGLTLEEVADRPWARSACRELESEQHACPSSTT